VARAWESLSVEDFFSRREGTCVDRSMIIRISGDGIFDHDYDPPRALSTSLDIALWDNWVEDDEYDPNEDQVEALDLVYPGWRADLAEERLAEQRTRTGEHQHVLHT
jgi:hypothetical protein